MIKKILKRSKETKELIGIRCYNEDDKFWCAYVEDYNDNIVQLRHFDEYGNEDGVIIIKVENIESLDVESDYTKCINYLAKDKNNFDELKSIVKFQNSENWKIEYLEIIKKENLIFSAEYNSDYVIFGRILDLSNNSIEIQSVGYHGEDEGKAVYRIGDITTIRITDISCKLREKLINWRMENK